MAPAVRNAHRTRKVLTGQLGGIEKKAGKWLDWLPLLTTVVFSIIITNEMK
ncbi:MAG: hypothetical protein ACLUTU_09715 [Blautia faecis]